ncbi:MAG: TIGR00730 family Rossman fold protein [Burkholderiaceae bacterium]|nr:MAG: TIGR00730 family Rossman fold protein [Burkholderiaceae bacterium]TAM01981.1 MAG: TIGR00730 family Rossman fold protein [Pusillimonas sp.]
MRSDELTDEQLGAMRARLTASVPYRIAFEDEAFMTSAALRPVRLQLELLKPEHYLHHYRVDSTVVLFGSARMVSRAVALKELERAEQRARTQPEDEQMAQELRRARKRIEYSRYYEEARRFSSLISQRFQRDSPCHFVVVTGGGPGIMEAGNRGAYDVGAMSVGLNITLQREQEPNPYISPELCFHFHYFALRKMHFMMRARALVAFPGGFGTLDELYEALTLTQTQKVDPMPIVLVGKEFWSKAINIDFLIEEGMISARDKDLMTIVETAEEIVEILERFYPNDSEGRCS